MYVQGLTFTINDWYKQASEIAVDDAGYSAPEHGQPGIDKSKIDIYAFGVLLLELLTGRRPFDKCVHAQSPKF